MLAMDQLDSSDQYDWIHLTLHRHPYEEQEARLSCQSGVQPWTPQLRTKKLAREGSGRHARACKGSTFNSGLIQCRFGLSSACPVLPQGSGLALNPLETCVTFFLG